MPKNKYNILINLQEYANNDKEITILANKLARELREKYDNKAKVVNVSKQVGQFYNKPIIT
jgi:hypothetical protein